MILVNKNHQLISSRITARMNTLTLLLYVILALCSIVPMHSFGARATHIPSSSTREPDNPSIAYARMDESEEILILPSTSSSAQVYESRTSLDAELLEQNDHEDTPLWKRRNFILLCGGVSVVAVALCIALALYFGLMGNSKDVATEIVGSTKDIAAEIVEDPKDVAVEIVEDPNDKIFEIASYFITSTSPPKILPPQGVKYDRLVVGKKLIDISWDFRGIHTDKLWLYMNITHELNNDFSWQKNVVFKKSDVAGVERIMKIANDILPKFSTHEDFKDHITPEKIPQILSNIKTLLNDRDDLDRFVQTSFKQESFTADFLATQNTPEHDAMNNGTLYYCPRENTTYVYGDTPNHLPLKQQTLMLFWLLRNEADDFLAYIEPVFKDFDNYVIIKSDLEYAPYRKFYFWDVETMLKKAIYRITRVLNRMTVYPPTTLNDTSFVEVEEWFLNNTSVNTQDLPTTVKISRKVMRLAAEYYKKLEAYTALSIFNILYHPEALASLVDDINKKE